jgi:hypothetical protein
VYRAYDTLLERDVAIKVPLASVAGDSWLWGGNQVSTKDAYGL